MHKIRNLVGGEFKNAQSGEVISVVNPANPTEQVGSVPSMASEDVQNVFAASGEGVKTWKNTGSLERGRILLRASALINERKEALADVIVSEMGKTKAEATGEVGKAAEFFEYYGSLGRDDFGQFLPDGRPGTFAARLVEPLGVVLLITPWNDPLLTPARKLAPALIAGNAVVIKPATVTPLITLMLAEILHEAGLPANVLGTVTGRSSEISDTLLGFSELKAVSFTGSTAVGKDIQQRLASQGVRVQTEMGGKNATVLLDDANLDLAVPMIIAGAFAQAGQRCTATSRLIVQRGIADQVRERLAEAVIQLKVGPGSQTSTNVGPVVDQGSQDSVRDHVARAVNQGATVIARQELEGDVATQGFFVEPTLLDVTPQDDIWTDEVFGPVLAMLEVDSLHEAIDLVNDSDYGLASSIFTKDLESAFEFLHGVDTGQVSINQPTTGWDIHHPFGGFKDSGSGYKEQARDALTFYTRVKAAAIRTH